MVWFKTFIWVLKYLKNLILSFEVSVVSPDSNLSTIQFTSSLSEFKPWLSFSFSASLSTLGSSSSLSIVGYLNSSDASVAITGSVISISLSLIRERGFPLNTSRSRVSSFSSDSHYLGCFDPKLLNTTPAFAIGCFITSCSTFLMVSSSKYSMVYSLSILWSPASCLALSFLAALFSTNEL